MNEHLVSLNDIGPYAVGMKVRLTQLHTPFALFGKVGVLDRISVVSGCGFMRLVCGKPLVLVEIVYKGGGRYGTMLDEYVEIVKGN